MSGAVSLTTWYWTGLDDDELRMLLRARSGARAATRRAPAGDAWEKRGGGTAGIKPSGATRPAAVAPAPVVDVECRTTVPRPRVVHLDTYACRAMKRGCDRCGHREAGGYLAGSMESDREISVTHAGFALTSHSNTSARLDIDTFWPAIQDHRHTADVAATLVGDWHSHPSSGNPRPSKADLEGWALRSERFRVEPWYSVIVTPGQDRPSWALSRWSRPLFHAYATRRDVRDPTRFVCEPAIAIPR